MTEAEIKSKFSHPSIARADQALQDELAAYQTDLEAWRDEDDNPMSAETISDLVERKRFEIADKYEKQKINGLYAYIETPIEFLQTVIPEGAPYRTKDGPIDPETGEPTQVPKILEEYTNELYISLDGTKAFFKCQARQAECGRLTPVTVDDIQLWIQYLGTYGYEESELVGLDGRNTVLAPGGDYVVEAETEE